MPSVNFTGLIEDVIRARKRTLLRPAAFFMAWSGVPTLAYEGFSRTLLGIKEEIDRELSGLSPEHPGSRWPKTTLGALYDDAHLTWEDVRKIREICDTVLPDPSKPLHIERLSVVVYQWRSMERRISVQHIPLARRGPGEDGDAPPPDHLEQVKAVLDQFSWSNLPSYWPNLLRREKRESHYRSPHTGASLVFDLESRLPRAVDRFINAVEKALPGRFAWFSQESLHITIRALV